MTDLDQAEIIDHQAAAWYRIGKRESLQQLIVLIQVKAFGVAASDTRISHRLSLLKVQNFDIDLISIVYHDIELPHFANEIYYLRLEVFVDYEFMQLKAICCRLDYQAS